MAYDGKMTCLARRAGARIAASAFTALFLLVPEGPIAAQTATYSYTYDLLGRITTASNAATGLCIAYSYDANGNRTPQVITTAGPTVTAVWGSGVWACFAWSQR